MIKAVILIAIAVIVVLLIVGVIDGNRFVVVEQQFKMPKLKENCRFVMISDLHNKVYGNDNDNVRQWYNNPEFRNGFCEFIGTISSQSDLD